MIRHCATRTGFLRQLALIKFAKYALLLLLVGCAGMPDGTVRVTYDRSSINIAVDNLDGAQQALQRSCNVLVKKGTTDPIKTDAIAWTAFCLRVANNDVRGALDELVAWRVVPTPSSDGLFTGYYEPTIEASRTQQGDYTVPIYARPADLVEVNLGDFRETLKGQRIAGRVVDGRLKPYPDRTAIEDGALGDKNLELYYARDPVSVFFLQIQGSGRLQLDDGSVRRVGYAAQNGHVYYAIGKELIKRGHLTSDNVSMQAIRAWLAANPAEGRDVMNTNPSYVFFRELDTDGPQGSTTLVLTPERSLAVDPKFISYHLPLWLETTYPESPSEKGMPFTRVMVAQDTGGAITGAVRGDVFFGAGDRAAHLAGLMKQPGRYYVLLPRGIDPNDVSGK